MRLIDADALKKTIIELDLDNTDHWSVIYKIDNAPTVEPFAEVYFETFREYERPHGKWLYNDNFFDCRCSYCGSYPLEREDYPVLSKFCPTCGAEMETPKNER